MTGYDEFMAVFGDITILQVIQITLAGVFLYLFYRKVRDYLVGRYEADKVRDEQLKEALEAVSKYPEYRKQSIAIQEKLESEIQGLRKAQEENTARLSKMEEDAKRRERNKLRDLLLQSYRYYTNLERNPNQTWTSMEAEAFWELFRDYEDAGGNGYVHTVVQPAMNLLKIVGMDDLSDKTEFGNR